MTKPKRLTALVIVMAAVLAVSGCSSEPEGNEVEGVVTSATGLDHLESFVVTSGDGGSTQFVPADGFNRTLDDLRDLVEAGEVVFVEFERASTGERVALSLEEEWRR